MADLAERINGEFHSEMHCIFNDDNADKLILRLRVLSDADDKGGDGADHDDTFLKNIEGTLLTQVALQGVHGIKKVFIRETDRLVPDAAAAGGYASEKEWMLDTEGVNLLEVMSHPAVDATRTISNDLTEVIEVLGIEAARGALLKEVRGVIEFDGSYVNYRHLAILCDAMTTRGYFAAITRHGINRGDAAGPLAQASFEETVEILYRASAYAERDAVSGVSQAVMLGQLAPVGTGAFGLLLDEARLADAVEVQVAGGGGEGGYGGGYGGVRRDADARAGDPRDDALPRLALRIPVARPLVPAGGGRGRPVLARRRRGVPGLHARRRRRRRGQPGVQPVQPGGRVRRRRGCAARGRVRPLPDLPRLAVPRLARLRRRGWAGGRHAVRGAVAILFPLFARLGARRRRRRGRGGGHGPGVPDLARLLARRGRRRRRGGRRLLLALLTRLVPRGRGWWRGWGRRRGLARLARLVAGWGGGRRRGGGRVQCVPRLFSLLARLFSLLARLQPQWRRRRCRSASLRGNVAPVLAVLASVRAGRRAAAGGVKKK
jgi:hypothetical protein